MANTPPVTPSFFQSPFLPRTFQNEQNAAQRAFATRVSQFHSNRTSDSSSQTAPVLQLLEQRELYTNNQLYKVSVDLEAIDQLIKGLKDPNTTNADLQARLSSIPYSKLIILQAESAGIPSTKIKENPRNLLRLYDYDGRHLLEQLTIQLRKMYTLNQSIQALTNLEKIIYLAQSGGVKSFEENRAKIQEIKGLFYQAPALARETFCKIYSKISHQWDVLPLINKLDSLSFFTQCGSNNPLRETTLGLENKFTVLTQKMNAFQAKLELKNFERCLSNPADSRSVQEKFNELSQKTKEIFFNAYNSTIQNGNAQTLCAKAQTPSFFTQSNGRNPLQDAITTAEREENAAIAQEEQTGVQVSNCITIRTPQDYVFGEDLAPQEFSATLEDQLRLFQVENLIKFLKDPFKYDSEFFVYQFYRLNPEILTVLTTFFWLMNYQPHELDFGKNFFIQHFKELGHFQNESGQNILEQLQLHYKAKIAATRDLIPLRRFEEECNRPTSDIEALKTSFKAMPQHIQDYFCYQVWFREGGEHDPNFGGWNYGGNKILENPRILASSGILQHSIGKKEEESNVSILSKLDAFRNKMRIPSGPIVNSMEDLIKSVSRHAQTLRVAMVTAELAKVYSVGGLAGAVHGMAKGFLERGIKVRVILPLFDILDDKIKESLKEKPEYTVNFGDYYDDTPHKIFKAKVDGISCYFIKDEIWFNVGRSNGKPGNIYTDQGGEPQEDGVMKRRWTRFEGLAAELAFKLGTKEKNPVNILQLHDSQTALIPKIIANRHPTEWKNGSTPATIFTIHNNNEQMHYYESIRWFLEVFATFEKRDTIDVNSFVSGLQEAEMTTTVSKQFAIEMQEPLLGARVEHDVKVRAYEGRLYGIVNGNTMGWNPETDSSLKNWKDVETDEILDLSYGPNEHMIEKRKEIKRQFSLYAKKHLGTEIDPAKPIFFYVGRLDSSQKGIDKLPLIMDKVLEEGGQFVCIGTTPDRDASYFIDEMLARVLQFRLKGAIIIVDQKESDNRLHWQQGHTNRDGVEVPGFGSLIRAAADYGVFPSLFEPCGLVQGEMHNFGVPTLATDVGGFHDTIFNEGPNKNGLLFRRFPDWHSEGQKDSIRHGVIQAINEAETSLEQLYSSDIEQNRQYVERVSRIITNARNSGWTQTSDESASPIARYKAVFQAALKFRERRSVSPFNAHLLGENESNV